MNNANEEKIEGLFNNNNNDQNELKKDKPS